MALITLIDPTGHTDVTGVSNKFIDVDWRWADMKNGRHEDVIARHAVGDSSASVYETSYVQLQVPNGKVWDSMFIPITRDGSKGLMLSRWGKDHWCKGQFQVKVVSEADWSTVVRDKAIKNDYECQGFIGRRVPIDAKYSFMTDWYNVGNIPVLPQLAFNRQHAEKIKSTHSVVTIGRMIGMALLNILPTDNFLEMIKPFNVTEEIRKAVNNSSASMTREVMDMAEGLIMGLQQYAGNSSASVVSKEPPEPQIDREATYASAWGGFA